MSAEAYKVAVQISLVENVTRGLSLMARHFRTTDMEAKVLQKRLESIGKMALAGGILGGAGAFGLNLFKKPIEDATEYERKLAALRQMGLGDAQVADARKFAEATRIMGTSMQDRLRLFVDAQGSFRQSGLSGAEALRAARTMTPIMAQYEVATAMLTGGSRDAAEGSMRNLNKIVEMMGGLNDTGRAKAIADGVFKAAQSSGRMVDERQLKQFVAYGSSATNQLGLRTIFGGLEPIIGEMGGSTTGTGLRTAYNRVNGMLALMPHRTGEELRRLGLADASGTRQTDALARLQATDTIGYAQQIMRRYQAAGITSRVDSERENAILFGTNGAKVMNKIMSQMPVLLESLRAYDRSKGATGVTGNPRNKMLMQQIELQKREADLKLRIGQAIMPAYVKGLELIAGALERVNRFAASSPIVFKGLVMLFAAVSGMAIVGGSLLLLTSAFRGLALLGPLLPMLAIPLNGIAAAMRMMVPYLLPFLSFMRFLIPTIGEAIALGAKALLSDLMMIFTPAGLVIAGVAAAALLVWNNWTEIKGSLVKSWADIKQGVVQLFHGDILGALTSFSGVFIRGWQTVFNTLIAGLNTILPTALQIGKFHFADDFDARFNASNTVRPGSKGSGKQGDIYLDGRKVGQIVTNHQQHAASAPRTGGNSPDWSMARVPAGLARAK
jgi:hypothetical protein